MRVPAKLGRSLAAALVAIGAIAAIATTAATGCSASFGQAALTGGATLRVSAVLAGGAFRTQTVSTPPGWAAADVNHVVVKLYALSGSTESEVLGSDGKAVSDDVGSAEIDHVLAFGNLHPDSNYRVRGFAYKAAGTDAANLISKDAVSYVDVTVAKNDQPTVAELSIQLEDKLFDSQATSSIELIDGTILDATTSLTTTKPS